MMKHIQAWLWIGVAGAIVASCGWLVFANAGPEEQTRTASRDVQTHTEMIWSAPTTAVRRNTRIAVAMVNTRTATRPAQHSPLATHEALAADEKCEGVPRPNYAAMGAITPEEATARACYFSKMIRWVRHVDTTPNLTEEDCERLSLTVGEGLISGRGFADERCFRFRNGDPSPTRAPTPTRVPTPTLRAAEAEATRITMETRAIPVGVTPCPKFRVLELVVVDGELVEKEEECWRPPPWPTPLPAR